MEIKNSGNPSISGERVPAKVSAHRTPAADRARPGDAAPAAPAGDRVTLTPAAQRMVATNATDPGAPVDRARVDALRDAIANGTYRVDSERIADRLLHLEWNR